jgi:hypothetical protein
VNRSEFVKATLTEFGESGELRLWQDPVAVTRHPGGTRAHSIAPRPARSRATPTLALRVHGREPTHSEMVSIRRALAALRRAGEVRIFMTYERRHYWVRAQAWRERSG